MTGDGVFPFHWCTFSNCGIPYSPWAIRNTIFKNAQTETDQPKSGMFALFKHYPKEAFTVLFLTAGGTLAFILTPPIYKSI